MLHKNPDNQPDLRVIANKQGLGKAAGFTVGGVLCLGLLFLVIAGTVILSLISTYTPPHGSESYGEEYAVDSMMLRSVYANLTQYAYTFDSSPIVNSQLLSSLCSGAFRNIRRVNLLGCVMQNFRGFGPYDVDFRRRRRGIQDKYLYSIGRGRIFYPTPCGKPIDQWKAANDFSISACVKKRIDDCNAVFSSRSIGYIDWLPMPRRFGYVITSVDSNTTLLPITKISSVPSHLTLSIAKALKQSCNTLSELVTGCKFVGQRPRVEISGILGV